MNPVHLEFVPRRPRFRGFPRHRSYVAFVTRHHPTVLLADDDEDMRLLLTDRLQRDGFRVTSVPDGFGLERALHQDGPSAERIREAFDLVISDIRMPGKSGFEALSDLRALENAMPFIVITGLVDSAARAEAERLGASAFFAKPFELDDLCTAAAHLVGR